MLKKCAVAVFVTRWLLDLLTPLRCAGLVIVSCRFLLLIRRTEVTKEGWCEQCKSTASQIDGADEVRERNVENIG